MGSSSSRGKLRTYLGIAPGVGKTYLMLRDGRSVGRVGVDVVVAYWERHGRAATVAQVADLEVLATRAVVYRGTSFQELDLEAVLGRRPRLAVVDELAHANIPGSPHEKRWQDVEEILAHGMDVYTTLNVANIESLRGLVSEITGVGPAEPVPDDFLRSGEVRLVDLEPGALRRRLAQGLVFPKESADVALSHYFRFANLSALQELAQLWLDDSVADPVATYVAAHGVSPPRKCRVVLVGVEGSPADEWLIRYAGHVAELSDAILQGVHVRADDNLDGVSQACLDKDRRLLEELSGSLLEVKAGDTAHGLVQAARRAGAAQLVVGSRHRSRLSRRFGRSTVAGVLRTAGDLPVQLVNVGRAQNRGESLPGHKTDGNLLQARADEACGKGEHI
ncbi:MAG: universal stress protein [Acidimicrobiales bacterium]